MKGSTKVILIDVVSTVVVGAAGVVGRTAARIVTAFEYGPQPCTFWALYLNL